MGALPKAAAPASSHDLAKTEGIANLFNSRCPRALGALYYTLAWPPSDIILISRMEEEDEDSMYAPAESTGTDQGGHTNNGTANAPVKREGRNDEEDGEEEGEELEEEESDSVGAAATIVLTTILTVIP